MFTVLHEKNRIIIKKKQVTVPSENVGNSFSLLPPLDRFKAEFRYLFHFSKFMLKTEGRQRISDKLSVVLFKLLPDGFEKKYDFEMVKGNFELEFKLNEVNYRIEITNLPCSLNGENNYAYLGELFKSGRDTDVKLKVDGNIINAHKIILSSFSDVFDTMFNGTFNESANQEVSIEDIEYEVMNSVVEFCYSSRIKVENINFALKVLMASNKYNIKCLKETIEPYIQTNVSPQSALEVLCIESLLNHQAIKNAALNEICGLSKEQVEAFWDDKVVDRKIYISIMKEYASRIK